MGTLQDKYTFLIIQVILIQWMRNVQSYTENQNTHLKESNFFKKIMLFMR